MAMATVRSGQTILCLLGFDPYAEQRHGHQLRNVHIGKDAPRNMIMHSSY